MKRKAKNNLSAILLVGMIFSPLGFIFLLVGLLALGQDVEIENAVVFCSVFIGMGLLFLLLGTVFIVVEIRKILRNDRLLNSGCFVDAEITGVDVDYSVNINGRSPYYVLCRYQDPYTGEVHIFRSGNIYFDPEGLFLNNYVRVYVEKNNYNHYYVDLEEVLPKVKIH